eukprot:gene14059-15534_t
MTSRQTFETNIHSLQRRILEKVELNTNYANTCNQIRYLTNQLNFYDRPNKPGYLSFQDFLHYFLQRMNFISLNTKLEYLFYHYDSDLYQQTEHYLPILAADAITIFERIRSSFLSIKKKEQHNFLKFIIRLKNSIPCDYDGFVSRSILLEQLYGTIMKTGKNNSFIITKRHITYVLEFFDLRKNETIHFPTFLRYLKPVISFYRRYLIRTVYHMLDCNHHGFTTVGDIKACYYLLPYSTIKFRGKTFHRATLDELLEYFYGTDDSESITWDMFYEYYQCISLSIDSDELFELVIRHSWSIPNGVLDGKPMANEHEDVFERPRPSSHDSSDRNSSGSQHTRLLSLPMIPISPIMDHKTVSLRPMSLSMRVKPKVVRSNDVASRSPDSLHSLSSHLSSSSLITRPKSATSVSRPIVVVHSDYSEETVRIHDELGNRKLNPESLRNTLQAMGIIDIKYVKV